MQIDLKALPPDDQRALQAAAAAYREADDALRRAGTHAVARILATAGPDGFVELTHLPPGDVYDAQSGAQYYFHAHRGAVDAAAPNSRRTGIVAGSQVELLNVDASVERGHFHCFLRPPGLPPAMEPPPDVAVPDRPVGAHALCHLIAVGVDGNGMPRRFFTTNRWVTDETFYWADDVIAALPAFHVDHAAPCWATNRWLTALVALFRPQIERLIRTRDAAILARQARLPAPDRGTIFDDRSLEVTSEADIDVSAQLATVEGLKHR